MFTTLIVQPLYNLLVASYNFLGHDLGFAILALTVLLRIVLYPLAQAAMKSQLALQEIQPKLKALQEQHRENREALARATMSLYREHKVNPFSSCLPVLIQLPFFIGIYMALQRALHGSSFELLYPFVAHPGTLNGVAFGFLPLASPSIPLAVIAAIAQWWQARMLVTRRPPPAAATRSGKDEDMLALMNKQMTVLMPIMTAVIGATLPSGLSLYWLVSTVLQGLQQRWLFQKQQSKPAAS
ncbi:membrane protein insertase YidC [Candidatus Uhrbacteria bacterium]|nr:membrane protein insertase YidC [Candidatus Uhrbacteria bacterium]